MLPHPLLPSEQETALVPLDPSVPLEVRIDWHCFAVAWFSGVAAMLPEATPVKNMSHLATSAGDAAMAVNGRDAAVSERSTAAVIDLVFTDI